MLNAEKNIVNDGILKNIHDMVHTLKTGTISIRIRDHKIIKIETIQEQQFDEVWIEEGSGI